MSRKLSVPILIITAAAIGFFSLKNDAQAANCGGDTACACGDTVTASTTLTSNLTCTGHGLVVGANNITIDGNGYSLTGDGGIFDSGIINTSVYANFIIIKNFSNITNFGYGIIFASSSNNQFINNILSSNSSYGIYLISSPSSTFTNNTMFGNGANLRIYSDTDTDYDYNQTIDTTNTVEGKPVYYLYNQSNQTYDGDVLGDIGVFWCISCNNIAIKNATLAENNYVGVYLRNTASSTVQNITAAGSTYGIYLKTTSSTTVSGNTVRHNSANGFGIYLTGSLSNTISNNTFDSNVNGLNISDSTSTTVTNNTISYSSRYAVEISSASSTTLTSNTVSNNVADISDNSTSTYSSNQFFHNVSSTLATSTAMTRMKNLNDTVSFDVSMFNPIGTSCADCTATITTSPAETITSTQSGNNITGSFSVTRSGLYSLNLAVTDVNSNTTKRNYYFWVNATSSATTKFYFRGFNPTHGQPWGGILQDGKSLLLTAPTSTETWLCGVWVQNSPDEIPDYPLALLTGADNYFWYKSSAAGYFGIQKIATYDTAVDSASPISAAMDYTWHNTNLIGLNWELDYPHSWYWLATKLRGLYVFMQTQTASSSYADFTYTYATTPSIKLNSNPKVIIVSATTPAASTSTANIVLDNPNSSATSTSITLTSFNYPFSNLTNTIYSDGENNLAISNLTANATTSFDSVNMAVTPSIGSVEIVIDTWETGGSHYKKWTESVTYGNITTNHVVGDMEAGVNYNLKVDGAVYENYEANDAGQVSFGYSHAHYGTRTLELVKGKKPGGGALPMEAYRSPEPPPHGGFNFKINQGDLLTSSRIVSLDLTGGPDTTKMAISNYPNFHEASQEEYQETKEWDICSEAGGLIKRPDSECGEGTYTVYAKFYTRWGEASEIVSSNIVYSRKLTADILFKADQKLGETPILKRKFNRDLYFGITGDDIKLLLKILFPGLLLLIN